MKFYITSLLSAFACFVVGATAIFAQQIPLAPGHVFRLDGLNPASGGAGSLHQIEARYRQQGFMLDGWRSTHQFLSYHSSLMGERKRFGWGIMMSGDQEHTESRVAFSPGVSARIAETEQFDLTLGFSAGVIHWTSNYNNRRLLDQDDILLQRAYSYLEVNAAMGARFNYQSKLIKGKAQVLADQLPGSLLTSRLDGIPLRPHALASGEVMATPIYNVWVGPLAFYRNTLNQRDTSFTASTLDAGLKVEFERQRLWVAGAYRLNQGAVTGGLGMQISGTDPQNKNISQLELDFSLNGSYPLNNSVAFGPEVDLGLIVRFAPRPKESINDSLLKATIFWRNDGLLNSHRVKYLDAYSPPGLQAYSSVEGRRVEISYDWPDNSLVYVGDDPIRQDTIIRRLGFEWIGVDGLLQGLAKRVVTEALTPDDTYILDPENLEPLQLLTSVSVYGDLRVDYNGALMGAEGEIYKGEFGTNNATLDTLFIPIVFDDQDTLIAIQKNNYLTNLELATLKIHGIQRKLMYELDREHGDEIAFLLEGTPQVTDYSEGRRIVWIKKPRLTSGFTNQQDFQINRIQMKFLRFKKYADQEEYDPNWTPRNPETLLLEEEEEEDPKAQKKKEKQQEKKKKQQEKEARENEEDSQDAPEKANKEKAAKKKKEKEKPEKNKKPKPEEEGSDEWEEEENQEWELPGDYSEEEE